MTKRRDRFPGSNSDRTNRQGGVTNGLTRRNFTGFLAASAALSVSGCALIVPEPAPEVYDLVIGDGLSDIQGLASGQILITEPKVLNSLNSDRIVIRPSASQITYFPRVRWSDRLPRMVQLYLSRAYSLSGGARAVGLPGDGLII
ncbi:MAG: ABC-type transport auxiliary lipoprotein family protein, partial [Pseudomonadota bacterium]